MAKKNFGNSLKRSNNLGAGIQNLLGTSVSAEETTSEVQEEEREKEKKEVKKNNIKQPKEKVVVPETEPIPAEPVEINIPEKPAEEEQVQGLEKAKEKKAKVAFSRTFYIPEGDYKTIENFIRYKIMEGEIRFSQKNALNEALNLLREVVKANISVEPLQNENKAGETLRVHSFNMLIEDYNFINEVLRIRRMQGQIKFTQANVISEALNLLRKKYPNL
ncbi:MAG: hypothetical protein Q8907_00235 [Bacteroidota bacterium]|nr:hypothetical protein [Bacteroidota bacterium]